MKKKELRKLYLEKRNSLSEEERERFSIQIFQQFITNFNLSDVKKIHIFLPIKKRNEVNTWYFIRYFWEKRVQVFVPKIENDRMANYRLTPETVLEENDWGILEPVSQKIEEKLELDLVIIPLLYSDNQGNRLGYGKGFYDVFFSENSQTKKIGVNFFTPNQDVQDVDLYDIPLDYLVTPSEMLSFSSQPKSKK